MDRLGESIRAKALLAELQRRSKLVEESRSTAAIQLRLDAIGRYHRLFGFAPEQHERVIAELEAIRSGNGKRVAQVLATIQSENGLGFVPSAPGFASGSVGEFNSVRG